MKKLTDDQLRDAVSALRAAKGNESEAARLMGIPRPTYQNYLKRAKLRNMFSGEIKDEEIGLPDFPEDDIAIESVIDHLSTRYQKREGSFRVTLPK